MFIYIQKNNGEKKERIFNISRKKRMKKDAVGDVKNGLLDVVFLALHPQVPEKTLQDHVR